MDSPGVHGPADGLGELLAELKAFRDSTVTEGAAILDRFGRDSEDPGLVNLAHYVALRRGDRRPSALLPAPQHLVRPRSQKLSGLSAC